VRKSLFAAILFTREYRKVRGERELFPRGSFNARNSTFLDACVPELRSPRFALAVQ
jgi:hypothetical protein